MPHFQIRFVTDSVQLRIFNVSNSNVILNAVLDGAKACQVSGIYLFYTVIASC